MIECNKCGYKWLNRKPDPKECPKCKVRLDVKKDLKKDVVMKDDVVWL